MMEVGAAKDTPNTTETGELGMSSLIETDLTHDEMLEVTQSSLTTLLRLDSILSDLPADVMLEEVLAQIAVEHGQSITIFLSRETEPTLKIVLKTTIKIKYLGHLLTDKFTDDDDMKRQRQALGIKSNMLAVRFSRCSKQVPQDVTVIILKKAIARHYEIYQHRIKDKMKISWKYIWRTYGLHYDGVLLDDDNSRIADYGVGNKTTLKFKKKLRKKRIA